jgi:hypothetical protein
MVRTRQPISLTARLLRRSRAFVAGEFFGPKKSVSYGAISVSTVVSVPVGAVREYNLPKAKENQIWTAREVLS